MENKFCIGFIGNREQGHAGSRQNTGNFVHGHAARKLFDNSVEISTSPSDENIEKLRASISHVAFVAATTISVGREFPWGDKNLMPEINPEC